MEQKLHTPEGVRDIYNRECAIKLALQKKLNTVLHLYGYQDIQTPTFEYFDVFRKEIGSTSIRDLYKFFDREGNILALRPDITPSIARAVATLFETENFPIRLCYAGKALLCGEYIYQSFQLSWTPERKYAAWCRADRCGFYRGRCRNARNGCGRT